ncbi:amino acid ABC transporter ATP-binding protein, PAAT family (TC 3.A.1.3.-) [Enterococcus durans]|uniref:Amino acid ABC transporter ATP-binding protein, PAAT family (TC 3.A.1.3.-) n=1 Tax=Enterococcus durans TaxID=53345 RepID=A0A377KKX5_9ENTE|nr:ABC transporter ATP-binding protein [Enterococcus durans]STP29845.1 amino acid ABC transporter ATP-binding protein, PAAT family (TC 3.A.1.3.-) [Enterococcus durans]
MKAVLLENVSKVFPDKNKAIDNITISIEPGEVFGFLGPNGAGKTTTVKILNGMLQLSGGECWVFDIDPMENPEKVHALAGVVTEHAQMYDNLSGIENLMFYGAAFGINKSESFKRATALLERLNLTEAKDRKLGSYSTRMRQRLSLARAMIHQPKILFLHEPTSGLDPESAQSVNHMIRKLAQEEGMTIFLCTHQLRYAQEICTSYGLIDKGALLAMGTLEQLRTKIHSGMTVKIETNYMPGSVSYRKIEQGMFEVDVQTEKEIPSLVKQIVEAGGYICHVSAEQPTLEDIYFSLIEKRKGNE